MDFSISKFSISLTNYFVMVFTSCGKWLDWNKIQDLPVDSQMETFYISIKCIVAFHVNMLQQIHLPVNSINGKREEMRSKTFQPPLLGLAKSIYYSLFTCLSTLKIWHNR